MRLNIVSHERTHTGTTIDQPMRHFYRFYLLMAHQGHFADVRLAHCADDACAMAKAAEFIGRYPAVEIWNANRKVARLSAEEDQRPELAHH